MINKHDIITKRNKQGQLISRVLYNDFLGQSYQIGKRKVLLFILCYGRPSKK